MNHFNNEKLTLEEAEKQLAKEFEDISLIGELYINLLDLTFLGASLKSKFRRNSQHEHDLIRILWKRYPLVCLTTTVFIGIYKYDGNYWDHFTSLTGCQSTDEWKTEFLIEIQKRNMLQFDITGSRRYVSTILGHAGIPQHSFQGFMNGFIQPSLIRHYSASESLDLLKQESTPGFQISLIHKGVQEYLLNGGKPAEDLVDRCMQAVEGGLEELNQFQQYLPKRILRDLKNWMIDQGNSEFTSIKKVKYNTPTLYLSAFLDEIYVEIPIQVTDTRHQKASWVWSEDQFTQHVECDFVKLKSGHSYEIVPRKKKLLIQPKKVYELTLSVDEMPVRSWHWNTNEPLVFSRESRALSKRMMMTTTNSLLIIHRNYLLKDQTNMTVLRDPLLDTWSYYNLYTIVPDQNEVLVFHDGKQNINIPIIIEGIKPSLSEDGIDLLFSGNQPTYHQFPNVLISSKYDREFINRAEKWTILVSHGSGKRWMQTLNHLCSPIIFSNDEYVVLWADDCPITLAGDYEVRLLGPLGSDVRFNFTLLPRMIVKGIDTPQLPQPRGGFQTATIEIEIDPSYDLTVMYPSDVDIIKRGKIHILKIPTHVTDITCQISATSTSTNSFMVTIVSKMVSWSIPHNRSLDNSMITVPFSTLYDQHPMKILLNTFARHAFNKSQLIDVVLSLRDLNGREYQRVFKKGYWGADIVVDSSTFADTVNLLHLGTAVLWITFLNLKIPSFQIMTITREWAISNVHVHWIANDTIRLSWHPETVVQPKSLKIWDEFHPWNPYLEYSLYTDQFSIDLDWSEHEPGNYLFEWAEESSNDDPFSFFAMVKYPNSDAHTFRWEYDIDEAEVTDFSIRLLSHGQVLNLPLRIININLQKLLLGLENYGESFVRYQSQYLDHWRELGQAYQEHLARTIKENDRYHSAFSAFEWLIGIHTWPVEILCSIPINQRETWVSAISNTLPIPDFGELRPDDVSLYLQKPSEDVIQILQVALDLEQKILPYNMPALILKFLIQFREDYLIRQIVSKMILANQFIVMDIFASIHERIPKTVQTMLKMRFDDNAPIPMTYLFLISLSALINRLIPRNQVTAQEIKFAYELEKTIYSISTELFDHDLFYMESALFHAEGGSLKR